MFRNLTCQRIQVDEMWAFIGAKQKNVTPEMKAKNPAAGDVTLRRRRPKGLQTRSKDYKLKGK